VVVVVVAGVFAYHALNSAGQKSVQTKRVVNEQVDQAVQDFKDLVDQNTQ
jgi:archaellin